MTAKDAEVDRVDPLRIVSALIEMGHVDTAYRDHYLERARSLLDAVSPLEELRSLERARRHLAELSPNIARGVERGAVGTDLRIPAKTSPAGFRPARQPPRNRREWKPVSSPRYRTPAIARRRRE